MAQEEKAIISIEIDSAEAIKSLNRNQEAINALAAEKSKLAKQEKELRKQIEKNGEIQKGQTKAIGENGVATKKQQATLNDLAEQQVENNRVLKETKTEYQENERQIIRNNKANKSNTGSLAEMRAELARDQQSYVKLSKAERENEQVGGVLQKRIKAQSDELKDLEKDIGITSRSVGDYGSAMQNTLPLMGGFGQQIQGVVQNLGQIKSAIAKFSTAQKGMAASTKSSSSALKRFRIALISTGIGAIVVLLGSLLAAFSSTQRGADAFTKILRPLQEILQSLLGVAQRLATDALDGVKKAFENPREAIIKLGEAIKENFLNRIEAIPILAKAVKGAIVGSFKLIGLGIKNVLKDVPLLGRFIDKDKLKKDLEETKKETVQAFKDLGSGVIQIQTGIDRKGQKELFNDINNFVTGAVERGTAIDQLTKQIEINAISLNREVQKGNKIFQEQRSIAEDRKRTDEERIAASIRAQQVIKETTKLQVDQQNLEIELAKLKAEGSDTDRIAQKEIQELIAERERLEAAGISKVLEVRNQANSVAKERAANIKKEEDDKAKEAEKNAKAQAKLDIDNIDSEIKALEQARQLELALTDETNEEKFKKEEKLLDDIAALRAEKAGKEAQEKAEKDTESIKDDKERAVAKQKIIDDAVAQQELEDTIAKAELLKEEEGRIEEAKKEFKAQVRQQTEDLAAQSAKALLDASASRAQREKEIELDNLKAKLESGLITQAEFEKKREEIERKSFNNKKKRDLAVIAIDLAKEISAINAAAAANPNNALTFGIAGLTQAGVLTGLAIARSGIQAAIVGSAKFAQGGVIHGASHAQGGVNVSVGGSGMIEAEGGEAIINKRSTAKHMGLLSAINQDGGGVPLAANGMVTPSASKLKFGNGGVATTVINQGGQLDLNDLASKVTEAITAIPVQVVASETTAVANRVQSIEDSASF